MKKSALLLTAAFGLCFSAFAEAAEKVVPAETSTRSVIMAAGWPMFVILGLSFIAVILIAYFLFTLNKGQLVPATFMKDAHDAIDDNDIEALQIICRRDDSPTAKIVSAAVEQLSLNREVDYLIVRDAVEGEGSRQAGNIWQRIQYLMDIGVIAPMVGLLGTVLGMIEAFTGIQQGEIGSVKPTILAGGVSKAMVTTAGGLIVGIATMLLYALFRGRVNNLIGTMEDESNKLLTRLMGKHYKKKD